MPKKMKDATGLLGVACACMVLLVEGLVEGLVARHATTIYGKRDCQLKDVAYLTIHLMKNSLSNFDKTNGEHLGTWFPGFPKLEVYPNSIFSASEVVCTLTFMNEGLKKILEDQKNNLNPTNTKLHDVLDETIVWVKMLKDCIRQTFKVECEEEILPPKMPEYTFDRKQWSHTLLMSAKNYLDWLQSKMTNRKTRQISKKTSMLEALILNI